MNASIECYMYVYLFIYLCRLPIVLKRSSDYIQFYCRFEFFIKGLSAIYLK